MKKRFMIVLAIVLIVTLTACQPTPTQGIVKEKNLDKMIEEATRTQTPAATTSAGGSASAAATSAGAQTSTDGSAQPCATTVAQGQTLADKMGAQKTYVKELVDAKEKVKIHVNADVQVPDVTGVTVQRVEQDQITQAQVDTLIQRLMKGDLFSGNDYKPSKSEIQNQILKIQAALANGGGDASKLSPKLRGKAGTAWLQSQIGQLQEDLKTAPEQSVKTPITSKFTAINPDDGGGEGLYALSQPASDMFQNFQAYNYSDGTSFLRFSSEKSAFSKTSLAYFESKEAIEAALNQGLQSLMTQDQLDAIPDLKITQEDAKKTADDIVASLGLNGQLVCISEDKEYGGGADMTADMSAYVNPRRCVWFLRYARSVNGVPVTYTTWDCMKVEKDNQAAPWSYEDMTIAIDDSGVAYFDWGSPYKMADVVTQNSNVMSFKDAMNVFDTMGLVVNAWDGISDGSPNLKSVDIKIDHIQFGLTRITEQNKRDAGLLVPCWDFFGTMTYISEVNGKTQKMDDGPIPILTVNAIDGSIINRSLGY